MDKCCICGKPLKKDTHVGRKTLSDKRTCSRKHYYERLRREGHWNKGLKWEDMYDPSLLGIMRARVEAKGKYHFNTNRPRIDVLLKNLLDNPNRTEEENKEIQEMFSNAPKETLKYLMDNMEPRKEKLYQLKAHKKYGRKCAVCEKVLGQIDVHHKDGNRKNNDLSNLIVLCPKHHREAHKNMRIA